MAWQLPQELVQFRSSLRRFVAEEIEPRASEIERSNEIPSDIIKRGIELGLQALSIPEQYGGTGESEIASCVAIEALSHGPGGATYVLGPNTPAAAIRFAGNEEQRERFLPRFARGEVFPCFCLTEAAAGSDAAGIETRAERKGNRWIINGSKLWITRASHAGVFLVSALTDAEKRGKGGITFFVMEKRAGINVGKPDRLIGVAGSGSAEVSYEDCHATDADVLGTVGSGFEVLKFILGKSRLWAAAKAVGILSRALEVSLQHVETRRQFGRKIGEFQAIKLKLADMASDLYISRLLLYRAAELYDAGLDSAQEASIAKLFSTEAASRGTDMAIQIHGAMGVSRDYYVERLYRDSRVLRILDGTSDIQRLIIASNLQRKGLSDAMAPGGLV